VERRDVLVRERWAKGMEEIRVVSGSLITFNDQIIWNGEGDRPHLQEIDDPAWRPAFNKKNFKNINDLRQYAEREKKWMIIAPQESAELLGLMYRGLESYRLGRYLVLGWDLNDAEMSVGEWEPTHIKYRYLCIGWGGHDILYGPGCISYFAFPRGGNTDNLDDILMCELQDDGVVTYYGEPMPEYSLEL
jgi:hypothetical protein